MCLQQLMNMCKIYSLLFSWLIVLIVAENPTKGIDIESHANWELLPKDCGRRSKQPRFVKKIQSGTLAKRGYHPWMANIFMSGSEYFSQNPQCGGSILNEKYILTAGHCCSLKGAKPLIVRVGEFDFKNSKECTQINQCNERIQDFRLESFLIHPEYTVSYKYGYAHRDICLIRLNGSIIFNDYVEPLCLPRNNIVTRDLVGETMEFAGWGQYESERMSMQLRVALVTMISSEECEKTLHKLVEHNSSIEFCAQGRQQKFCYGDSGGPLAYKGKNKAFSIIGIASYSTEDIMNSNCEDDDPMVFTDVTKFLPWILDNLKP